MRRWIAAAAAMLSAATLAGATQAAQDSASCVYKSESYSEGAAICAQKGLMLTCSASADRLVWKVARETELSELCRGTPGRGLRVVSAAHRMRRTPVAARAPASNAKCFFFSGKTYCE